jgi:hypothetical protein
MNRAHFATLVGAAAAAASVISAPLAGAQSNQPHQSCQSASQSATVCQSPGNVEVKNTPPSVTFYPYGSPCPTCG